MWTFIQDQILGMKWLSVLIATTVGVLTEVPVMLALCWFANKTKGWFQ